LKPVQGQLRGRFDPTVGESKTSSLPLFSSAAGVDDNFDDIRGLCARCVRAVHEPVLVLEPGEAVPAVRRLQDCREHTAPGQQPGHGVDGHVLLSRAAHHQRGQADDHDVRAVVGGAHVQRAARRRVPGQPEQQLLPGPAPHHAVLVRVAGRLRHRVDRTVVALRPVLAVQEDLSHIHQFDQEGRAQSARAPGPRLHSVARDRHTAPVAAHPHHILLGLPHVVAPGSQQRPKSKRTRPRPARPVRWPRVQVIIILRIT